MSAKRVCTLPASSATCGPLLSSSEALALILLFGALALEVSADALSFEKEEVEEDGERTGLCCVAGGAFC